MLLLLLLLVPLLPWPSVLMPPLKHSENNHDAAAAAAAGAGAAAVGVAAAVMTKALSFSHIEKISSMLLLPLMLHYTWRKGQSCCCCCRGCC